MKILDNGFKFIPNYNLGHFNVFKNLMYNLENEIFNFNRQVYIKNIFGHFVNSNNSNNFSALNEQDEHVFDSLNDFFNFFKCKNGKKNFQDIPLLRDSLLFQLELFKEMNKLKINNISNLTRFELNSLKRFVKEKPFKVVELDKNIGVGFMSNELYDQLSLEMLNDQNTYLSIENDPKEDIVIEIKSILIELFNHGHISRKLYSLLLDVDGRLGSFRILPKLHKSKYGNRPIINYKEHITSSFCYLIDFVLRPLVKNTESFILDSQNLIQKLENIEIPDGCILATGDFDSLYSNIVHEDCIFMICDFLKDKLDTKYMNIRAFNSFLKIVLKNNFFKYNNRFYLQIKGIAMGTVCGPSIANIFVYIYESKWLYIHRPLAYYRFIDDVLVLVKDLNLIDSLKNAFGSLTLNFETGNVVKFLDLEISIDLLSKRLNFCIYFKPTNTFSYLYIYSNHPNFIFKNIVTSVLIRIRRICTKYSDFVFFYSLIHNQFILRGYESKTLTKIFTMVSSLDRNKLLKYKEKKKMDFNNNFLYRFNFDNNISNFTSLATNAFNKFKRENLKFNNFNLKIVNKLQLNLSSLLVHNFKFPSVLRNFYKKCRDISCKTCLFSNNKYLVYLTENFTLPIFDSGSCNSKNCVYIIFCSLCCAFYIGQTMCIKDRIYNHIYNIKNFTP